MSSEREEDDDDDEEDDAEEEEGETCFGPYRDSISRCCW